MKLYVLDEPPLQFAGGTHVDIRAGLRDFGAFDRASSPVGAAIGIGVLGTSATVAAVRGWLESCAAGVVSNEEKHKELRPSFPPLGAGIFGARFEYSDTLERVIPRNELQSVMSGKSGRLEHAVELFMAHARDMAGKSGLRVLIVAPPAEVFALGDQPSTGDEDAIDDGQAETEVIASLNFHDLFKAQALDLTVPCQLIRPDTYGLESTSPGGRRGPRPLQGLATRAWNIHTALYYKAGGVPWRLVRHSAELQTCYVGTSFYRSATGDRLLTSVAQVFNERGEGFIVQGGNARIDREDRTPHLSEQDAKTLLSNALAAYRREHRTSPARVVVHKTSYFDAAESRGSKDAANEERVDTLDLVSVRRSGVRLLPASVTAIARGTALELDDSCGLVYLKGMVPFFKIYPGMYVPSALEFTLNDGDSNPLQLAKELLELSKLNFNNTQFDSGDAVTILAARRVGDVLKHVAPGKVVQSRFRYFT